VLTENVFANLAGRARSTSPSFVVALVFVHIPGAKA